LDSSYFDDFDDFPRFYFDPSFFVYIDFGLDLFDDLPLPFLGTDSFFGTYSLTTFDLDFDFDGRPFPRLASSP